MQGSISEECCDELAISFTPAFRQYWIQTLFNKFGYSFATIHSLFNGHNPKEWDELYKYIANVPYDTFINLCMMRDQFLRGLFSEPFQGFKSYLEKIEADKEDTNIQIHYICFTKTSSNDVRIDGRELSLSRTNHPNRDRSSSQSRFNSKTSNNYNNSKPAGNNSQAGRSSSNGWRNSSNNSTNYNIGNEDRSHNSFRYPQGSNTGSRAISREGRG